MIELSVVLPKAYPEIARFHAAFPGDPFDVDAWRSRFDLWWEENPAFAPDLPRGWVLRDTAQANAIVGFLGNIPRMFQTEGKERLVFGATTWRVLQEHRGASLKLYLAHLQAGAGTLLFNTTANAKVAQVLEYLRFNSVPSYPSGRTWLVPLRFQKTAIAYLRNWRLPTWVTRMGAAPLKIAALPMEALLSSKGGTFTVERIEDAGPDFDRLWERTKDRYSYTSVRSAAQLKWLTKGSKYFPKTLLGCHENGVLRGYALFSDARWRNLRVLELTDLWTDFQDEAVARALVAGARRYALAAGYELVVLHDYSLQLAGLYRSLGIIFTTRDIRRHFFGGTETPEMLRPQSSYFTGLDGDWAV